MSGKIVVRCLILLSLSISTVMAFCANSTSDVNKDSAIRILPEDLYQYGLKHDCSQISSFYKDRPGVHNPPYVFGLMTKKPDVAKGKDGKPIWFNDYSAALWCHRAGAKQDEYTLLLDFDHGTEGMASCQNSIEKQEDIGGLSIIELSHDPLAAYFDPITKEQYKSDHAESANGPAIFSEYDGAGHVYYCYKKRWLVKALD